MDDEYLGEVEDNPIPESIAALHPDVQADLLMYSNPEALMQGGAQIYELDIRNARPDLCIARSLSDEPQNNPLIVQTQIHALHLRDMMMAELLDVLVATTKDNGENLSREDLFAEILSDEHKDETLALLNRALVFLHRIFPHLAIKFFNLAFKTSVAVILRPYIDDATDREEATRKFLEPLLKDIECFLKERINMRSKGRPAGEYEGLAGDVWRIALEMMGEHRGKGSAPGLKAIADRLGMTTDNLSKKLRKLERGWLEVLKPELEDLPPSVLAFGYTKRHTP